MLTYSGEIIRQTKQETLLDLLQTKFGQLPTDISQHVSAIEQIEELDGLLRKIITANSLEDMGLNNHHNDSGV